MKPFHDRADYDEFEAETRMRTILQEGGTNRDIAVKLSGFHAQPLAVPSVEGIEIEN